MKNILILIGAGFKRNKLSLIISVMCAVTIIVFMCIMANSAEQSDKIRVGIIDYDNSVLSQDIKNYLSDQLDYVIEENTYDNLSSELIKRNISVIIEIPQNFFSSAVNGNTLDLQVTSMNDFENRAFIDAYLNSYLESINYISNACDGKEQLFTDILNKKSEQSYDIATDMNYAMDSTEERQQDSFKDVIGIFLLLSLAASIFIGFTVFDDRSTGTYNRIKLAPINSIEYVIGITFFGLIQLLLMNFIVCAYIYLNNFYIGISEGLLFLGMALMSLFYVGFSLVIGLMCKSKTTIMTIIIGFSTLASMLGGAFFPISNASDTIKNISKITPQYWFMNIIRNYQNIDNSTITSCIIVLFLFAILIYLIAGVLFAQKKMQRC